MTNELTNLLNGTTKFRTDFDSFSCGSTMFKNLPYGKTLYTLRNEKLVAFKLVEMVFCGAATDVMKGYHYCDGKNNNWRAHINVAGEGHKLRGDLFYFEWFYSVDDYKAFCNGDTSCKHKFTDDTFKGIRMVDYLRDIFGAKDYKSLETWYYYVLMYYAKKGATDTYESRVVVNSLYMDDKGAHLTTDYKDRYEHRVYSTKEDALLNAMVSDVVEFEDEEKEEKTTEMEININIKVKSKDDAIEQFAKYIETKF